MNFLQQLSNREQNIIGELILEVTIALYFVSKILSLSPGAPWMGSEVGWIVTKTIGFAIIGGIILMGAINMRGEEPADERDLRIAAKANRIAYISLYAGICMVIGVMSNAHITGDYLLGGEGFALNDFHIIFALMAALTLSSFIKSLGQLYLYQWGKV